MIEEVAEKIPFTVLFDNFKNRDHAFLLDSGLNVCKLGKFSFFGFEPFLVIRSKGKIVQLLDRNRQFTFTEEPFSVIKKVLKEYHRKYNHFFELGLNCGLVGYFGYDLCHFIEQLPSNSVDDLQLPECYLCAYDPVIIYDHSRKKIFISTYQLVPSAKNRIAEVKAFVYSNSWVNNSCIDVQNSSLCSKHVRERGLKSNFTKEEYIKGVVRVKEYISAGDIFQVNLSQRFEKKLTTEPYKLYSRLRSISPAPFASYLSFDGIKLLSSSPERFLKLVDRKVETRPMKGTRPRGKTVLADKRLKRELLHSRKDKAELVMITDLLRNDLGKVCRYGSVKVKELRIIESHPTVYQATSTVIGELLPEKNAIDLLMACFPGGSITGAPKIRAMEIIDELEPTKRGPYTGALGYIDFNGNMDLAMIIRTFVIVNSNVYFQVGGGIVADSIPEMEYEETLHKAMALIKSLQ